VKFSLQAGGHIETTTPAEMRDLLRDEERRIQAELRGIKMRRLPLLQNTVAAGAVVIGGDGGQPQVGPESGYVWVIRMLAVNGLTPGTTPDQLNLQIFGSGSGFTWWQFTGNIFAATYTSNSLWMEPGEYLGFTSGPTFTAANGSLIQVKGTCQQVPAEMWAKLAVGGR
jgi:hypothetical protein